DIVGLTTLGVFHTAISLLAVVCGIWAFARYKRISLNHRLGQVYLASTLITAVTALGIFQHGGFGPLHALAVLTLVALAVGGSAEVFRLFLPPREPLVDRKSTRLNSSHVAISYAVFCLKKKNKKQR